VGGLSHTSPSPVLEAGGGVRWIEFRALGDEGASGPSPMAWQFVETGTRDRPRRKNWSVESPENVAALIREAMRSEQAGGETAKIHMTGHTKALTKLKRGQAR
jgi:hypothetical protein